MTGRRLVVRIAITLLAIAIGLPIVVIGAADLGLDPMHWSGARLSGVALSPISRQKCPPGSASVQGRKYGEADLQAVSDRVIGDHLDPIFMGWVDPCHDRYEVTVCRLDHTSLAAISRYGDAVAVRLDSYCPLFTDLVAGPDTYTPPGWWTRADPVGTWFTLVTGFPLYLGGVLAVLAAWWALALRRYRRRRTAKISTTVDIRKSTAY
jgi:hypothetical protein